MIHRFCKIDDGLYRGSAPSVEDVINLHKRFGIKKIVSLDFEAGERINRICKLLNINHINIPITEDKKTILNLLHHNLIDLLKKNGPTFIHCMYGKDRTGFLSALYKVKHMGMHPDDAIKEAELLGFGIGVDPNFVNLFKKIIYSSANNQKLIDQNNLSIVDNERVNSPLAMDHLIGDLRDTYLDEGSQASLAPFNTFERTYPFNPTIYNYVYDSYPTRNNYDLSDIQEEDLESDNEIPIVGLWDNSVIKGLGPVDLGNGFVNY